MGLSHLACIGKPRGNRIESEREVGAWQQQRNRGRNSHHRFSHPLLELFYGHPLLDYSMVCVAWIGYFLNSNWSNAIF